jgi:hypothetical protein
MSDDDHSDRDMGAPSPGGMSSLGGGSRPGSPLGGLDDSTVPSMDDAPISNLTRSSRSASKAAAAAMAAASHDDDEQVNFGVQDPILPNTISPILHMFVRFFEFVKN